MLKFFIDYLLIKVWNILFLSISDSSKDEKHTRCSYNFF